MATAMPLYAVLNVDPSDPAFAALEINRVALEGYELVTGTALTMTPPVVQYVFKRIRAYE